MNVFLTARPASACYWRFCEKLQNSDNYWFFLQQS